MNEGATFHYLWPNYEVSTSRIHLLFQQIFLEHISHTRHRYELWEVQYEEPHLFTFTQVYIYL